MHSPLTVNPALTGAMDGNIRVLGNYKDQWHSMNAYKTFAVSGDMNFLQKQWKGGFLGGGLAVFNDKAGDSKMGMTQVLVSAASHIFINDNNVISAGLQGGWVQKSLSYDSLKWDNMYDGQMHGDKPYNFGLGAGESYSPGYLKPITYWDYVAGLNWAYSEDAAYSTAGNKLGANLGFAMYHITQPKQITSWVDSNSLNEKLYSKIVVHGGGNIPFGRTKVAAAPAFLFMKQGSTQEITAGALVKFVVEEASKGGDKETAVGLGGYYRVGDSFIITAQGEVQNYAIGVSYDINTSGLKTQGGLELSLRYISNRKGKR